MIRKFKLTGLSKPSSASIERIGNNSEEKRDIPVGLSQESFDSLFSYCKTDWGSTPKIALVACDSIDAEGWPVNPTMAGIENA